LIRERSSWVMLAMLIGMAGTGCRRSNPAYRWPIDAARGPDRGADSPASIDARIDAPIDAHVDAAIDKVSVDTLPDLGSLELGGPELGYRDAGQEVADAGIVDAAQDQRPDGRDASLDRTDVADLPRDASGVFVAGDAADAPSDATPGLNNDGSGDAGQGEPAVQTSDAGEDGGATEVSAEPMPTEAGAAEASSTDDATSA